MVLAICGDVKAEDVRKAVEKQFGKLKAARTAVLPKNPPAAPLTSEVRKVEIAPREQAVIFIGYQGVTVASPDRFAMEVLQEGLSGLSSPLFRHLRDELALCYYTGASQLPALDPGYFLFYIGTDPAKARLAETELAREIGKIRDAGLAADDLGRAKAKLISEKKIAFQSNGDLAGEIALDELYGLGYNFYKDYEQRYNAVTAADIQRVAKKYFGGPAAIAIVQPKEK